MSAFASRPKTSRTLWITDRSATMAATPTAMQTKKNSRRRQAARVSRTAIRRTKIMRVTTLTRARRPGRRAGPAARRRCAASSASCVTRTSVVPRARWIVAQQLHDVAAVGGVEVAGRLVGQDNRRSVGQRARERDALLLAARQLRRVVMRAAGQPDLLEQRSARRRASADAGDFHRHRRRSRTRSATESDERTGTRSRSSRRAASPARLRRAA